MTVQTTPVAVMDPNDAFALVHSRIYSPVFFEKLATDFNLAPQTEEEAYQMLNMAASLRQGHMQEEKQASSNSLLSAAQQHLNSQLQQMGLAPAATEPADVIKQAAVQGSFDPELSHAFLSLEASAAQ